MLCANTAGRFAGDRGGNVAMMWALMGTILIGLIGLTVDFTRAQTIRARMQNAVDGAALVAERGALTMTLEERTAAARALFDAEMGELAHGDVTFTVTPLNDDDGGHRVTAAIPMPVTLARIISPRDWTLAVDSEAQQGGRNIEVALVLDTTGSMSGSRISDLRAAAVDLVTLIVDEEQEPYYTKAALVPYSMGVNVGSYADSVRGPVTGGRSISAATWASSPARNISGATRASPVVVTANNHGFSNGDRVYIRDVGGMTQINNRVFTVAGVTTNTFQLKNSSGGNINGGGYNSYTSGGMVTRCEATNCEVVVTADNHGLATNDYVHIRNVNGMTNINNSTHQTWRVTVLDSDRYSLNSSNGPSYSAYTSGGTSYCVVAGCQYYRFTNVSGSVRVHQITNCVTERVGSNWDTDVAPSTSYVGRNYPSSSAGCSPAMITPLTDDVATLTTRINALQPSGTTAGQIGIDWGWYMLSPNFGYLWPSQSRPGSYNSSETLKIAVLMTDGEFNTHYCNGVAASNATGVSSSDRINCSATNGDGFDQAEAICEEMKEAGIVIYTVGFDVGNIQRAQDVLENCATTSAHAYTADDGDELRAAFQAIGNAIAQLRLTH